MRNTTVLVFVVIAAVSAVVSFFIFQQAESHPVMTNSCAFLGVSKIAPREMQQIQDSQEYQNIMTLTDDDLRDAPKLFDLIHRVSDKIDYNDQSSLTATNSEMYQYHKFLSAKFKQQRGFDLDQEATMLSLEYGSDTYLFSVSEFPEDENISGSTEFTVSKNPTIPIPRIKMESSDFDTLPKVKDAIDSIGSYQVSSYENTGMEESEWNQYNKWFEEKYYAEFGNATSYSTYFRYGNQTYTMNSSIC